MLKGRCCFFVLADGHSSDFFVKKHRKSSDTRHKLLLYCGGGGLIIRPVGRLWGARSHSGRAGSGGPDGVAAPMLLDKKKTRNFMSPLGKLIFQWEENNGRD